MEKAKIFFIFLAISLFALVACGGDDEAEVTDGMVDDALEGYGFDIEENLERAGEAMQEAREDQYSTVDGSIINEEMITAEFPSDLPVPGGKVDDFEHDEYRVDLRMFTGSSVEEAYDWLEENLAQSPWEVTDSGLEENVRGFFIIEKEDYEGDISIAMGYGAQTTVGIHIYNY